MGQEKLEVEEEKLKVEEEKLEVGLERWSRFPTPWRRALAGGYRNPGRSARPRWSPRSQRCWWRGCTCGRRAGAHRTPAAGEKPRSRVPAASSTAEETPADGWWRRRGGGFGPHLVLLRHREGAVEREDDPALGAGGVGLGRLQHGANLGHPAEEDQQVATFLWWVLVVDGLKDTEVGEGVQALRLARGRPLLLGDGLVDDLWEEEEEEVDDTKLGGLVDAPECSVAVQGSLDRLERRVRVGVG